MIGADSRCTEGELIFDENILKIHRLAENIYGLGAGTSADCDFQTRLLESQLELLHLNENRQVRVAAAVRKMQQHLFRYQGFIGAFLIIVGIDVSGVHIAALHPYGNASFLPFVASGWNLFLLLCLLECDLLLRFWRIHGLVHHRRSIQRASQRLNLLSFSSINVLFSLKEDEAKEIVRDALYASITTDLYSGSKINMFVIGKDKLDKFLPYETLPLPSERSIDTCAFCFSFISPHFRQSNYTPNKSTTNVLSTEVKKIRYELVNEQVQSTNEPMDEMP